MPLSYFQPLIYVHLQRSNPLLIINDTPTLIIWDTIVNDPYNLYKLSDGGNIFIPDNFKYGRISGNIVFDTNGTGSRKFSCDFSNSIRGTSALEFAASPTRHSDMNLISQWTLLQSGDFAHMFCQQDSGINLNLAPVSPTYNWMILELRTF